MLQQHGGQVDVVGGGQQQPSGNAVAAARILELEGAQFRVPLGGGNGPAGQAEGLVGVAVETCGGAHEGAESSPRERRETHRAARWALRVDRHRSDRPRPPTPAVVL